MIWNILQLIFCIILFVLPLALYKSHRSFMVRFYDAMIHSVKAVSYTHLDVYKRQIQPYTP